MSKYSVTGNTFAKMSRRLRLWQMCNRRTAIGRHYIRLMDWINDALIIPRRYLKSVDHVSRVIPVGITGVYFIAFVGLENHRFTGPLFLGMIVAPLVLAGTYLALRHPERMFTNMIQGSAWAAVSSAAVISLLHPGIVAAKSIAEMAVIGLSLTAYINIFVSILCRTATADIH